MMKKFSVVPMILAIAILLPACHKDKEKPAPDPEISFTANKDAGSSPVRVDFNNTTTNSENVSWSWDFGDDSTSTEKNPKHYYYSPGTYIVKLTAARNGKTFPALTKSITVEADATLVVWYKLDGDNTTNGLDASGNGYHISRKNSYDYNFTGHKGIVNTAIQLSGSSSQFSPPLGIIKDKTTNANLVARTTISLWIYPTDLNGHHGIFSLNNDDGTAYVPILFTYDNQLRGMFWDNPDNTFVPMSSGISHTLTSKKWHHIALSGDENGQSLYLDGKKVGSRDKAISHLGMSSNNLGNITVRPGDRWFLPEQQINAIAAFYFKGLVDDVRIYHKRLSDDEIKALSKE